MTENAVIRGALKSQSPNTLQSSGSGWQTTRAAACIFTALVGFRKSAIREAACSAKKSS
jgi:hypothetical protein